MLSPKFNTWSLARCQITEATAPFHTEQSDKNLSVISEYHLCVFNMSFINIAGLYNKIQCYFSVLTSEHILHPAGLGESENQMFPASEEKTDLSQLPSSEPQTSGKLSWYFISQQKATFTR